MVIQVINQRHDCFREDYANFRIQIHFMHKLFCQLFIAFVCAGNTNAEITATVPGDKVVDEKWENPALINNIVCRSVSNRFFQNSKSPYFTDEYKTAKIKLTSGRIFENVKMRIDLAVQQTYFIASNSIEINIDPGMVKEITYSDTTANGIIFYKFQTGFPAIDRQNKNNFYLVLADGNCKFLKSIVKKASEIKKIILSEIADEYETYEEYYLFAKGGIRKLKKDKEFILAEMSDKQIAVNEFILSSKTNFRNTEHLIKLFNYYNSL